MLKYIKLIYMSFKVNMTYRSKVLLYIVGGLIQTFMYYYIWNAVFDNGNDLVGGYSRMEFITYILVSFAISSIMPTGVSNELSKSVRSGDIISIITKPLSIDYYYLFYNIGHSIIIGIFMGLPLLIMGYFYLGIYLPSNTILFFISLILGLITVFYLSFIIGQLSFFTTSVVGIVIAYQSVSMFLSGSIFPLTLLPRGVKAFIDILPFKSGFSIPLNIYLNKISGIEILYNIIFQIAWIFILKYISDKVYKNGFEKISILGG